MEDYEKLRDATDIKVRNQQASIKNIETQLGKLTKLVNEWLPSKNPNPKPHKKIPPLSL